MRFTGPTFGGDISGKNIWGAIGSQSKNLSGQQGQSSKQRSSEYGTLMPQYSSLLNSGYSDAQKAAINQSTLGAINEGYGGAQDSATRRMARTNNSAGYGSMLDSLARGKTTALANQNLANQKDFADEQLRRKMMGLQGISQLYGVDTSFLNSLNQGQNQLTGIGAGVYGTAKNHPGFFDTMGSAFAGSFGQGAGSLLTGG